MNGNQLIVEVRNILRDPLNAVTSQPASTRVTPAFNVPSRLGSFWSDAEIILALNSAQDIFVNYCLNKKLYFYLDYLFTSVQNNLVSNNPLALPSDYLHYASGSIGVIDEPTQLAQIHIGGDTDKYLWTMHDHISIIEEWIYFIQNGAFGTGILFYYKQPSYIGATSLGDALRVDFNDTNFEDYVYNDIFVNHASVILGAKDTWSKRDASEIKGVNFNYLLYPKRIENYIEQNDNPIPVVEQA